MNRVLMNKTLQDFWDSYFKQLKPTTIKKDDITVENPLDEQLFFLGKKSKRILDIGTGSGYCLFVSALSNDGVKEAIGIDPSPLAVNYINETCKSSNIEHIKAIKGDHTILSRYDAMSFDGIICSNTLDVVPKETSKEIISEIKRLIAPGGYVLLKLNFYLTDELVNKIQMKDIGDNMFEKDGVLRALNYSTKEWISQFSEFHLVTTTKYQRILNGPKDRVIVFQNK